jgi:hypothetical protein
MKLSSYQIGSGVVLTEAGVVLTGAGVVLTGAGVAGSMVVSRKLHLKIF